jgi:hypothetical protein
MRPPFNISFPNGNVARAIQVGYPAELTTALSQLGIPPACPTLVLVGGASGLSNEVMESLQNIFIEVLAPLAETLGLVVIDGGTEAGVMQLMGQARQHIGGTFPLVGVAAIGTVIFPNLSPPSQEAAPLEPNHSHFVLVPGNLWGDESPWIARVASSLARDSVSATVLINGGKIAWMDVTYSVKELRPVVILAGSGRTADTLAAMLRGENVHESGKHLTASGLLRTVDVKGGSDRLATLLQHLLCTKPQTVG